MRPRVRAVVLAFAALAVLYLLFAVVFPWFDRTFVTDPVVDAHPDVPVIAGAPPQERPAAAGPPGPDG